MIRTGILLSSLFVLFLLSCGADEGCVQKDTRVCVSIDADTVINTGYIGNGVQWDPYSLDYGNGHMGDLNADDWNKIYSRLDNMKPAFIRVMQNTVSKVKSDTLDVYEGFDHLSNILDYCQSRNVTVMFGDWGGWMVDHNTGKINSRLISNAVDYLKFLVVDQGYTCIKYYNLINEPNGYWSVTNGDYDLWMESIRLFWQELTNKGLSDKVSVVGPDSAIWSEKESWWVTKTANDLGGIIGLYDIHTYPSKITINSGQYTDIISAYKKEVPKGYKIVMGEIGIKFVEKSDSLYNIENVERANACPHASKTDSQMFVYDYMYGTDMADALFQTINSGFSGSIVWMLDDAMHTHEAKNRLKIWGFWNILGDEIFGPEEERVRPWYYAWSLLCRYIPAGSDFYKVSVCPSSCSIRAVCAVDEEAYTIAVVNSGKENQFVELNSTSLPKVKGARIYRYGKGLSKVYGDCVLLPEHERITVNFRKGFKLDVPAESMLVITNMQN